MNTFNSSPKYIINDIIVSMKEKKKKEWIIEGKKIHEINWDWGEEKKVIEYNITRK